MNMEIQRLEELALNAFPAILTEFYDGWILRYSNGYTYRGNCINPIYSSYIELNKKIEYCEEKYISKGLPCIYKMTENVDPLLDEELEKHDYKVEKNVYIMGMDLKESADYLVKEDILISNVIKEEWLDDFLILNETDDEHKKITAKTMLNNIKNNVICASIVKDGKMTACGLGVLEDDELGLYDIRVAKEYRRRGYARSLCNAILREGIKNGADKTYLQVAVSNEGAINLYNSLGFKNIYEYWYRVKNII